MAIDPSILQRFSVQDNAPVLNMFQNALTAQANREAQEFELQQARAAAPMKQRQAAAQAAQSEQTLTESQRNNRIGSLAEHAINISGDISRGNLPAIREKTISRLSSLPEKGVPTEETQQILRTIDDPNMTDEQKLTQLSQFEQKATQLAAQFGVITPVEAADKAKAAEVEQKQINTLRKDIGSAQKSFDLVAAARNRISKTGRKGTAASDISLVFNFMKMNDPGSTVREGEFATAQNAAGVDGRIISAYNNLLEGTRLNPAQREDFIGQAEDLFSAQRLTFDSQIENTLQQADQDGLPRERVLGKKRFKEFQERQAERAQPQPLPPGVTEEDIAVTMQANNMTREQVLQRLGGQ